MTLRTEYRGRTTRWSAHLKDVKASLRATCLRTLMPICGLRQSGGLWARGASLLTDAMYVVDAVDATAQALFGADERQPNQ